MHHISHAGEVEEHTSPAHAHTHTLPQPLRENLGEKDCTEREATHRKTRQHKVAPVKRFLALLTKSSEARNWNTVSSQSSTPTHTHTPTHKHPHNHMHSIIISHMGKDTDADRHRKAHEKFTSTRTDIQIQNHIYTHTESASPHTHTQTCNFQQAHTHA